MQRRQLLFLVLINALISLLIALGVAWAVEQRRPDPEELAALYTPAAPIVLVATPTLVASVGAPIPNADAPTPAPQPIAPPPSDSGNGGGGEQTIYVVEQGDSLLAIALRFNLTLEALLAANQLDNPDFVFSGQRLVIPAPSGAGATGAGSGTTSLPTSGVGIQIVSVSGTGDLTTELIEVANESDAPLNLQGWSLSGENTPVYSFGNLPLFPGGSVRVHSTGGADTSIDLYWGQPQPVWATGATVHLRNAQGTIVHSITAP